MKVVFFVITIFISLLVAGLWFWRLSDHSSDRVRKKRLMAAQRADPARFDPSMVSGLPEPARRYLKFAIRPGTPLYTVAEISMAGKFGLGTGTASDYMNMTAEQILALPTGFIWKMQAQKGLMHMSGSDSESWTRFWLLGLIPVARLGGSPDHARSAFGRYAAEAVFWTPAALLPGSGVRWASVDENTARVVIHHNGIVQPVDVTVAADGSPTKVSFLRWSDANPDKVHRLQPFGGYLSEYRNFGGFRLPTHVEAGNFFGTEDYFPFFIVDVMAIDFPRP
ncbi:MAG: DUF6544 family protein [Desulfobacterales bacterium]